MPRHQLIPGFEIFGQQGAHLLQFLLGVGGSGDVLESARYVALRAGTMVFYRSRSFFPSQI